MGIFVKFNHLNFKKEVIEKCRRQMDEDNIRTVKQVSLLLVIIVGILAAFYLLFDNKMVRNIICVVAVIIMLVIFTVGKYMVEHPTSITPARTDALINVFSAVCFLVGIYLGTFAAGDEMAVPSVWMFFFVVLIFNRLPGQNLLVVTAAGILFAVCSYVTKRPYIFRYDMMHAVTSIIAAIYMSWTKSRMKVINVLSLMKLQDVNMEIMETVEEQEKETTLLRHKAERDELTGLYKKKVLQEKAKQVMQDAEQQSMHALACIDIDNFKEINDTFGHLYGDSVLKEISAFIKNTVGKENWAARFGGDEFIVFFPNVKGKERAASCINHIIKEGEKVYQQSDLKVRMSLSAGLVFYPEGGQSYQELFEYADRLLYQAKKEGKNRCITS